MRANWSANAAAGKPAATNRPVDSSTHASPSRIAGRHRRQVIALPRIQQGVVGHGAGGDDARDFPLDQSLGQLGSSTCSQTAARSPAAISLAR